MILSKIQASALSGEADLDDNYFTKMYTIDENTDNVESTEVLQLSY